MKRAVAVVGVVVASVVGGSQVNEQLATDSFCPSGWEQHDDAGDDHTIVYSCERNGVLVVLNPDKTFNFAFVPGQPDFVHDPSAVPGWVE